MSVVVVILCGGSVFYGLLQCPSVLNVELEIYSGSSLACINIQYRFLFEIVWLWPEVGLYSFMVQGLHILADIRARKVLEIHG